MAPNDPNNKKSTPSNSSSSPAKAHLAKLRSLMKPLQGLIVPSTDAHFSEYIAPCDARRAFITGFTGSVGTAVITAQEAALWTDGRYFLQAERELDKSAWKLMKEKMPDTPTIGEWLCKLLKSGSQVGVDPFTMSIEGWRKMEQELDAGGLRLVPSGTNLIDQVWGMARPPMPASLIVPLDIKFAGKSWQDKVGEVRKLMAREGVSLLLLTGLDDIAWLLNLRGSDIPYNPVFFAYAMVSTNRIYLFTNDSRLSPEAANSLGLGSSKNKGGDAGKDQTKKPDANKQPSGNSVKLLAYESVLEYLKNYLKDTKKDPSAGKVWTSARCNFALANVIPEARAHFTAVSPVYRMKAVKNGVEIDGMRRAHLKDAVALCELFAWLEEKLLGDRNKPDNKGAAAGPQQQKKSEQKPPSEESNPSKPSRAITELDVEAKLEKLKQKQQDYVGPSFHTISGSGPNGALIHYHSSKETNRPITTSEMYLLDSGSQYRDGTTDVTRTVHFGSPSAFERECYTRVVKGHIALATARFPRLTKGWQIDCLARRPLWEVGLDYNHGTGHGVGHYLNVHEGPSSIRNEYNSTDPGIVEDMIFSNEPGYYEAGKFGIRLESLVVVSKIKAEINNFNGIGYLGFDTITLVPIQTKLLDGSILTPDEIAWIDRYHRQCREEVGKELQKQGNRNRAKEWLMRETEPIAGGRKEH